MDSHEATLQGTAPPPDLADLAAPMLRAYLAERDEPCPGCRYNLRGLLSDHCPECNQALRLRVGLVEPRLGWFLAAVIGASAGLGLNLLLLIYFVIVTAMRRGGPPGYFLLHNLVGSIIHGACVFLLLRYGPRIRRAPLPSRVLLTAAMWGLCAVNIVLFSLFIR